MNVKELMWKFESINAEKTVAEAAEFMDKNFLGSLLVEENSKPIGVVTERDFLRKVLAKGRDAKTTKLREIMSKPIISIHAEKDVTEASQLMDSKKIRRLAVINDDGKIIGKITANTISRNMSLIFARRAMKIEAVPPTYM